MSSDEILTLTEGLKINNKEFDRIKETMVSDFLKILIEK